MSTSPSPPSSPQPSPQPSPSSSSSSLSRTTTTTTRQQKKATKAKEETTEYYYKNAPSMTNAFLLCAFLPFAIMVCLRLYVLFMQNEFSIMELLLRPPLPREEKEAIIPKAPPFAPLPQKTNYSSNRKKEKEFPQRYTSPMNKLLQQKIDKGLIAIKQYDEFLSQLRENYRNDPSNIGKALVLAEALRQRDLIYHDGGSTHLETIDLYQSVLKFMGDEEHEILCDVYVSLGKTYFMANMFERALESYNSCLNIQNNHIESLMQKATTLFILGEYKRSANAYLQILNLNKAALASEVYTGISKVLVADESAVQGGWDVIIPRLEDQIPKVTEKADLILEESSSSSPVPPFDSAENSKEQFVTDSLKRMHLAMFSYHDTKTHNTEQAWQHLTKAMYYKMLLLPQKPMGIEKQRVAITKQVFHPNFWPDKVGSSSRTPIFIIGFVRSGSTLLERVLDAHPRIVGTGEDSVFNGRLEHIRDSIVQASYHQKNIGKVVKRLAKEVVDGMHTRWEILEDSKHSMEESKKKRISDGPKFERKHLPPMRFTDKMLANYMNVGFIHMLFPKALILHVVREPMDTVFSAYKHDFPMGSFDYTSQIPSLAELYLAYREIMEHWDAVLPGRVTHVRYEDLVKDMPGIARAVIAATGLKWDPDVLNFHTKKHAVNTLSTSQVRKGVYSHHIESWRRYEEYLQPLRKLLGKTVEYDIKTTLPGYVPPKQKNAF